MGEVAARCSRTAAFIASLVVAALAGACLVLIVLQLPGIVDQAAWNADSVMPWVFADSRTAGSSFIAGQYPFPTVLWFAQLTHWLPFHRVLWELAPPVVALCVAAAVAWPVWRIAGRWPAALAAAIVLCASPPVMRTYFWSDFHTTSFLAGAVLGAALVAVILKPRLSEPVPLAIGAVLLGLYAGTQLVDVTLYLAGIVPLVAGGAAWWLVERDRRALRVLGAIALLVVVAVLSAVATNALMRATGYRIDPRSFSVDLDFAHIRARVSILEQMVFYLGNGALELSRGGLRGPLAVAASLAMIVVTLVPIGVGARALYLALRRRPLPAAETAWSVFWGMVSLGLVASVLLTTVAVERDNYRYIVPIVFAGAATIPLLLRSFALVRTAALAVVAVYLVAGLVGLTDREITRDRAGNERVLAALEQLADEHGATHGFAEYWYASPLTWQSDGRLTLRPVLSCAPDSPDVCQPPLAHDARWYDRAPIPGPSLLVMPKGSPVPPTMGKPIASRDLGSLLGGTNAVAYVFDHDILPQVGPIPNS
jgi:hypothetical protein